MGCKRLNPWKEVKRYLLKNKLAIKGRKRKPDIWINNRNIHEKHIIYKNIISIKPSFICINDDWDTSNNKRYNKQMKELHTFLNKLRCLYMYIESKYSKQKLHIV